MKKIPILQITLTAVFVFFCLQGVDARAAARLLEAKQLFPELKSEFNQLRAGDWLLLDLDNTVFREAQMLGSDDWYSYELKRLMSLGRTYQEGVDELRGLSWAIKKKSRVELLEKHLVEKINQLQNRGVAVLGITWRNPSLAAFTQIRLRQLGINFADSHFPGFLALRESGPKPEHQFLFSGNIAFTDGLPKGLGLLHLFKAAIHPPSKIMAIDDRQHHAESMMQALQGLSLTSTVVYYQRSAVLYPFDPAIAEHQLQQFKTNGSIPSDETSRAAICNQMLKTDN